MEHEVINTITQSAPNSPVYAAIGAAVAGIGAFIVGAQKVKELLRANKRENSIDAIADVKVVAEQELYRHLSEQLSEYRKISQEGLLERNEQSKRISELEGKLTHLISNEKQLLEAAENMKARLDEKDKLIQQLVEQSGAERDKFLAALTLKDEAINARERRINALEDRIRELEQRLSK